MKRILRRLLSWLWRWLYGEGEGEGEYESVIGGPDVRGAGPSPAPRPQRLRPSDGGGGGDVVGPAPEWETTKTLDLVAFNSEVEPLAVRWLCEYLNERGAQRVMPACAEVAYRFGVSTETARRWIVKHSATVAELEVTGGKVTVRQ